jgi:HEAT repeat protein
LRDEFPLVRASAAKALGLIGPGAKGARPGLRKALGDTDAEVRADAAVAFWRVGGEVTTVLPVLLGVLNGRDERGSVRVQYWTLKAVVLALGEMRSQAKEASPALSRLLSHKRWEIRKAAVEALRRIDSAALKKAAGDAPPSRRNK